MPLILQVNSRNRIENNNSSDSNFEYLFEELVSYKNKDKLKYIVVYKISILKTYYLVAENNFFTLMEGTQNVQIVMLVGNYNIKSFAATLQNLLTINSLNNFIYTVIYDINPLKEPTTRKYKFYVQNNNNIQPAFQLYNYLFEQFGFNKNLTNYFANNTLTSKNVCNMNLEPTLFLHSSICKNNNNNILEEIFTTSNETNTFINYINPSMHENARDIFSFNQPIRFSLLNKDNELINLNELI